MLRIKEIVGAGLVGLTCLPQAAQATEAMMGRYMPGLFAAPAAGVVPPMPGVYWLNQSFYYSGSAKKNLRAPYWEGRDRAVN